MNFTKTATKLLLGGVATAALMVQANALEAQAFVDRLAAFAQPYGYSLEFGDATLDGDTVTVDGLTMTIVTGPGEAMEPMVIDTEITFSGVAEGADGSYTAESITVPDVDSEFASEPVGRITVKDIQLNKLYVPAGDPVPAVLSLQWLESGSTGPLVITRDGEEVFSIESMESSTDFNPQQGTTELIDVHSPFAINGIKADLSTVSEEDPATGAIIEQLGLSSIAGDITGDLSWSMADGRMTLNKFLVDLADVGAIDLSFDISGFTPAVLEQIYAMQAQMMASGEPTEEQAQAQMMQGMALAQGVSIVGASVRYDDASLAGKLLDFFAAQSGADRATFVAGLKSALPMMLAETGIPAINDLVIPPVSAFLDDPQSLEVKVAPPSPTSLLVLMAAAANPAGLITALGFAVEANTPAE